MRQRGKIYGTAGKDLYRDLHKFTTRRCGGISSPCCKRHPRSSLPRRPKLHRRRRDAQLCNLGPKTLDRIALLERNGEKLDDIRFSQESDTINVDGIDRPRTNSNGKPIAGTDEALRKFWRWFSGAKLLTKVVGHLSFTTGQ